MKMTEAQAARARDSFAQACRIVGGPAAMAKEIGLTTAAISQWDGIVPKRRVEAVAAATTRHAARHWVPTIKDLRPDL